MSIYLRVDTGEEEPQIATNSGWGAFIRWTDTLSPHDYAGLQHLTEFGWNQDIEPLTMQLGEAIQSAPPEDDGVRIIANDLLHILQTTASSAYIVQVTNGMEFTEDEAAED